MNETTPGVRVLFTCTGTGRVNRGIESFFREAFDNLKNTPGLRLRFLKGAGLEARDEHVSWSLSRTGGLASSLGVLFRRNGYIIEQWSSFPSVATQIRDFRPHVVFYSDANLGFLLFWLRSWIGVPYRLLFSNGGPVHPPFNRMDSVHQVNPESYQEALAAGEPANKHFFVPYGIRIVQAPSPLGTQQRNELRRRLGLPVDRKVVLSVGWIRSVHKRMDYLIEEVAQLSRPRPYLQLLGAMDDNSREIVALGEGLLGREGFAAHSVPYEEVFDFYQAADCFVLGSLQEGFGRVYLEALMHGLPVIAHDGPVMKYVMGSQGILADLRRRGELTSLLSAELKKVHDPVLMQKRWAGVRDRFSWPVLAGSYQEMFQICASASISRKRLAQKCRQEDG